MNEYNTQYNINYLYKIPTESKRELILTRIGYKNKVTELDAQSIKFLNNSIKKGESLCRVSGAYLKLGIVSNSDERVVLQNGLVLESKGLCRFLADSEELIIMAATAGKLVIEEIQNAFLAGEAAQAVIIDAVAAQIADAALDYISKAAGVFLAREGKALTRRRYSPGYGDLALSNQKTLFELLNLSKLGLELTEKYMLNPEKSVIAIVGIEKLTVHKNM